MTKPTKEEFQERNSKHTWFVLMYGMPVFLAVLGYAIWYQYFAPPLEFPLWLILHGIVITIGLIDFWFLYVYMARRFGLACTDCGKSMPRHIRSRRTFDAGKCPWCGERVWREA